MSAATPRVVRGLVAQVATFGVVGLVCLLTDIGLFNGLVFGLGRPPLEAKCWALLVTSSMAYLGHRQLTFRDRRGAGHRQDIARFAALTLLTTGLSLAPLYVARTIDGTGVVWLNAANLVGIAMGAAVRFVGYRSLVWSQAAQLGDGSVPLGSALARDDVRRLGLLEMQDELVGEQGRPRRDADPVESA